MNLLLDATIKVSVILLCGLAAEIIRRVAGR